MKIYCPPDLPETSCLLCEQEIPKKVSIPVKDLSTGEWVEWHVSPSRLEKLLDAQKRTHESGRDGLELLPEHDP